MHEGFGEDQKKLYRLIWQRTVASQMTDAKILRTKVTVKVGDGSIPNFTARFLAKKYPTATAVAIIMP